MKIHILGICGTFMGSLAVMAKQLGHEVSGSDANVYPPMSTQLESQGITLCKEYKAEHLQPRPDLVIIGNAMSRGNPAVEYVLNENIPYISGPQWLFEHVLSKKHVIAVAGTHGKTTTTTMLAWILEYAGKNPGFLIGGVPENFSVSARVTDSNYFVIEADEYDSAFFDKRSKFIHYHPSTLILNNLEFDHADIFDNISDIEKQFHFLLRTVPGNGRLIAPVNDAHLPNVYQKGMWTPIQRFSYCDAIADWSAELINDDGSEFSVLHNQRKVGTVRWPCLGFHNVNNALAAIAAAHHVGVAPSKAAQALCEFKGVKRRLQVRGNVNNVTVYDDFAHHPTAISTTLQGLRARVKEQRIIAVLELGSYTMKNGTHQNTLAHSWHLADQVFLLRPDKDWGVNALISESELPVKIHESVDDLINSITKIAKPNDHILVMSNRGFGGLHDKLLTNLQAHTRLEEVV